MTDDLAAENARLRAELARVRAEPVTFRRSDLRDARFFRDHREDILRAVSRGEIVDDTGQGIPDSRRDQS